MVTFVSAFYSYRLFDSQKRNDLDVVDAKLLTGVQMAHHLVGSDFHDKMTNADSVSPADYRAIVEKYNGIAKAAGFQFLSSHLFLPDGRIISTKANLPGKNTGKGDDAGFFETQPYPESLRLAQQNGVATYASFTDKGEKGRMLLIPFKDNQGRTSVVGAGIVTDDLDQQLKSTGWTILTHFFLVVSVITGVALALGQKLVRPVKRLHEITNIKAFREQEKALRLESEKNQAILRSASDGIHLLDLDGNLIEASDSFCTLLGYAREEMIGMNVAQWDANFSDDKLMADFRQKFENQERSEFETRHRRKDGSVLDVEVSTFPLQIDGKPVLFNSSRDITGRKQIQQTLLRSEANFRRAQAVAHTGSWTLDIGSGQLDWSDEVYRIFGIEPGTAVSFALFLACLHPDDVTKLLTAWDAALTGDDYDIEHRILVAGEIRWVRERAKIDFDADGTPLTGIGTVQDITPTRALIDALMTSEQRLSFALQGSNDGLWDWNLESNEVHFSPRWLEMVGYAEGELKQNFETWELLVHPDDKSRSLAAVADYIEGRTPRYEIEFRLHHKQGHWLHILSRAKWACDRDGQIMTPRRLVGTHVDLTERKRVEHALAHQVTFTESLINAQNDGVSACSEIETYPFVRFTVWNRAMQELTGYSIEEINQLGWYQTVYVDEQTQQQAQQRMNRMRKGDHLRGEKWTIARKNGERRTLQIFTSLVTTHDGKPHVLAVMHDISDQIRALAQLRESEERLRVLYEGSADPILLMENDAFIDCNKSAQILLGLQSRDQIRNVRPSEISPEYQPDGRRSDEKAADMIATTIDQGNHLFEWEHIAADGRHIIVEVMLTVVMHNHKPIMHVVWRDLSRLHSALMELQKRDRYQRALLDNFPFLVWLKDEESRYLAVNQPFAEAAGWASPDSIIGKNDFDLWPKELAEHYRSVDREVLVSNQPRSLEEQIENPTHVGWLETYKSPVTLDGRVIGTVGFARDISQRKQSE